MKAEIRIIPISGIDEIPIGSDLGAIIFHAMQGHHLALQQGDILVVTQKIVSKAEGRVVNLNEVQPSEFARAIAQTSPFENPVVCMLYRIANRFPLTPPLAAAIAVADAGQAVFRIEPEPLVAFSTGAAESRLVADESRVVLD